MMFAQNVAHIVQFKCVNIKEEVLVSSYSSKIFLCSFLSMMVEGFGTNRHNFFPHMPVELVRLVNAFMKMMNILHKFVEKVNLVALLSWVGTIRKSCIFTVKLFEV